MIKTAILADVLLPLDWRRHSKLTSDAWDIELYGPQLISARHMASGRVFVLPFVCLEMESGEAKWNQKVEQAWHVASVKVGGVSAWIPDTEPSLPEEDAPSTASDSAPKRRGRPAKG